MIVSSPPNTVKATDLAKAKDDALRPWIARAQDVIKHRIADARAHGQNGALELALSRLDELERELLYPDRGLLASARTTFYRQAYDQQRASGLDPAFFNADDGPGPADEKTAREHTIVGRDQYADIRGLIDSARDELELAAAIDRTSDDPSARASRWRNWEQDHRQTLWSEARSAFSDAQIELFEAVGQILLKPDLR